MVETTRGDASVDAGRTLLTLLDSGQEPDEGLVQRALRSPGTPAEVFPLLAECHWVLRDRRLIALVSAHTRCPRHLALQLLHHLGWHDLIQVAQWPRTPVPVRRQAEKRLMERIQTLTLGERINLSRRATRGVIYGMLGETDESVVQGLLDNPRCVENVSLRILARNPTAEVVSVVLKHPRWGGLPAVRLAAIRSRHTPPAISLGLIASLRDDGLRSIAGDGNLPANLKEAAGRLLLRRREGRAHDPCDENGAAPPLASRGSPPKLDS